MVQTVSTTPIAQLPPAVLPLTGNEIVPLDQNGVTSQTQAKNIGSTSGSGVSSVNGLTGAVVLTPQSIGTVSIGRQMTSQYTPTITNPVSGMTWNLQRQYRPLELFAPTLQTWTDDMIQESGYYTRGGNLGTYSYVNGQLNLASTADSTNNSQNLVTPEHWEFPGIAVSIEGVTPSTDATGFNAVGVGITKNPNNTLYCFWETGSSGGLNRITLAKSVGGSFSTLQTTANGSNPTGLSGLALSMDANNLFVWTQVSSANSPAQGWVPILTNAVTDFNFLSASELAQWSPFFIVNGGSTTPWKIDRFRTGYTGQNYMRDFRIVTNSDGTPYVSNGNMYFTATTNYCSVFQLNPKTGNFKKTGALMFNRGGTLFFDLNAKLVYDVSINKWRVFFASWGNNSFTQVKTYYATYDGDILNGVHTVGPGTLLNLSQAGGTNAVYDADVVFDTPNNRWMIAYSVSPSGAFGGNMYAAVDTSTDLSTFTSLWAASSTTGYEGSATARIGGNLYVFAGNGSQFNCWNASGTLLGSLSLSAFPGSGGNPPPHFVPFTWADADTTQYYALSWSNVQFQVGGVNQGTFANGSPVLYKAAQTESGFELPALGTV